MRAVYTEEVNTMCDKCCLNNVCPQEGFCKCDSYRNDNNIFDKEGDYYFVED